MRILVTGASGYLGRELVKRARARGWEAAGTHLTRATADAALDVRDAGAVDALVAELAPDAIVHTAYRQSGDDMRAVNVDGAANVAAAAARLGARLVHLSTDFVFDGTARRPYCEEDATRPLTPYGRTKLEGEREALGAASGALVVRTSLIYGGTPPSSHERMVLDAIDGTREVAFFEDEFRCPVAVADLADGLLELCPQAVAGVLHVAGPEPLSRLAFARAVAEAAGLPVERLRTARSADQPLPRPLNCALDCSRAQRLLGTRMRRVTKVLGQRPALT